MNIQQIRNATLKLTYAGQTFLIDPMLAEQGAYAGLQGAPNSHLSNPTVGLVVPLEELVAVDAVIVTHTHFDHWDDAAKTLLPKHLPVLPAQTLVPVPKLAIDPMLFEVEAIVMLGEQPARS